MSAAKIRLSAPEMELVLNTDWILTKNRILDKVNELFGDALILQQQYLQLHPDLLPHEVLSSGAKLSKGDNYLGLPYRVLDHPRYFGPDGHFAIRSFFWWGNFFSITLHLSGKYKERYGHAIGQHFDLLHGAAYHYCVQDDPWQHHFEKENYVPLKNINRQLFEMEIAKRPFIKLAQKIPLQEWDNTVLLLQDAFILLTNMIKN